MCPLEPSPAHAGGGGDYHRLTKLKTFLRSAPFQDLRTGPARRAAHKPNPKESSFACARPRRPALEILDLSRSVRSRTTCPRPAAAFAGSKSRKARPGLVRRIPPKQRAAV